MASGRIVVEANQMTSLRTQLAGVVFAAAMTAAGQAAAVTINFDNLADSVVVTNQYPQATFSSDPGFDVLTTSQNLGSSLPNFICTGPVGGSIDCAHSVFVDFTSAVNGLHFVATGANDTGVIGEVNVFTGGVFNNTVNINGTGDPLTPIAIDLTGFTDVTRIEIVNITDLAGLGYDDFTFNAGIVPEPGVWAMLLLGFGAIGLAARRARRTPFAV